MSNIIYKMDNKLYLNLTNSCPCACTFCIRNEKDTMGNSSVLWLDKEPTVEVVIENLEKHDLDSYDQIVFCGFGEPLVRVETVCEIAKYLKKKTSTCIKVDTNGLGNLIHNRDITVELDGLIDAVSISLNASNKQDYLDITKSKFGLQSFDAMLEFAQKSQNHINHVTLTVVDVIGASEIEKCREICENIGVNFRVREFIEAAKP